MTVARHRHLFVIESRSDYSRQSITFSIALAQKTRAARERQILYRRPMGVKAAHQSIKYTQWREHFSPITSASEGPKYFLTRFARWPESSSFARHAQEF